MSVQKSAKVNGLQGLLEEGLLAPTGWLEAKGYSRALISRYVRSGWLVSPAHGVYRRPGPPLKWQHVVASLQRIAEKEIHVGGRTALVQRGLGHYIRMRGPEIIFLYGPGTLPGWVSKLGLDEQFVLRNDGIFGNLRAQGRGGNTLTDLHGQKLGAAQLEERGLQESKWGAWDWPLRYSTDERAILELLQDVPLRESVYEADTFMQGLANLRPTRVMALLQQCTSIKVKRLFLALAERHQHQWLAHLNPGELDLGKGKRMLAPGGTLHQKYLITLPADLDDHTR